MMLHCCNRNEYGDCCIWILLKLSIRRCRDIFVYWKNYSTLLSEFTLRYKMGDATILEKTHVDPSVVAFLQENGVIRVLLYTSSTFILWGALLTLSLQEYMNQGSNYYQETRLFNRPLFYHHHCHPIAVHCWT